MADLIRASALKRAMAESCALPEWVRALVNCVIDDQETTDAVEVVRCKDCTGCRKRNRGDVRENTYAADAFWCDVLDAPVFLEDYCSSGCLAERGETSE